MLVCTWALALIAAVVPSEVLGEVKARLCVVGRQDGTGSAAKYCPQLNVPESPAVCVVAFDRLECLRHLTEGKADFTVLEAEDLLVASRSPNPKILVTNELRIWKQSKYEYQMLVIVRKTLNLTGIADLRGRKFCHPGYELSTDWPAVTSKFFESQVAPQVCQPNISVAENFIKSSSEYFGAACKPGPWVDDEVLDSELKSKYKNLCQLCDVPRQCSTSDKYWGREGSLTCLSDDAGDVAWARLSDVLFHFGIDPEVPALAVPAEFNVLCPNGTMQSLAPLTKHSPPPCSWMSRPWSVVAARDKMAQDIQKLVLSINRTSPNTWQWSLHYFLTSNNHEIVHTEISSPEDYLAKAEGFLAASAPNSCGAERAVRWCVGSAEEAAKCSWWREAALAHGVEPPLACVRPQEAKECIGELAGGAEEAEVTVVHAQNEALARRLGLKPLVYEYSSKHSDYYISSVIVKANSKIEKLSDLQGKKACFMSHMGIGWNSLLSALKEEGLLPPICPYEKAISSFFAEACVPGLNNTIRSPEEYAPNLETLCRHSKQLKGRPPKHVSGEKCCQENVGRDQSDAFHCLMSGDGDVAIVEMGTVHKPTECRKVTPGAKKPSSASPNKGTSADTEWFSPLNTLKEGLDPDVTNGTQWEYNPGPEVKCQEQEDEPWAKYIPSKNYRIICTKEDHGKTCHIGWSPKGLVMSAANVSNSRLEEVYVLLLQMDSVFGKRGKQYYNRGVPIPHFTLYGPHSGRSNVIFQDTTHYLVKLDTLKKESPIKHNYEDILNDVTECSSATWPTPAVFIISLCSFITLRLKNLV
ncbi:transferrin [Hetaerina americana]|uniref:transferrin n=1 Tax=Hetaerina americana TaxID=62018 RepID=UPI003A7F5D1E